MARVGIVALGDVESLLPKRRLTCRRQFADVKACNLQVEQVTVRVRAATESLSLLHALTLQHSEVVYLFKDL